MSHDFAFRIQCRRRLVCKVSCLIYVICVCLRIVVSITYCVVFLFCFSSSCVPYVARFSRLTMFYCPSVFSNVLLVRTTRFWNYLHNYTICFWTLHKYISDFFNCSRVDLHYSLLDFIRGGLEFKLVIAIDFTVSIHIESLNWYTRSTCMLVLNLWHNDYKMKRQTLGKIYRVKLYFLFCINNK